ncbi:Peptidase B [Jannaschia seosinensis]|uniref:Peptidase B n=1 Tax=Jannaschia seosinensis TaxID=313367 RepID=A0A0M7BD62_9RHOB|nr:leucyl aminopeptidase family protein [Jannaschia seosinensis]CUH40737.1 Peptidase B [Jannaschia seosinensis]
MISTEPPRFAAPDARATPIQIVPKAGLKDWLTGQDEPLRDWAVANGFEANAGEVLRVPGPDLSVSRVLLGWGGAKDHVRTRFVAARAALALKSGTYSLSGDLTANAWEEAALGWLLASYRFTAYAGTPRSAPALRVPRGVDAARIEAIAAGEFLTRDLINTPAADMGPGDLEDTARALANRHGAAIEVTSGAALREGFPLIHTVGRAAATEGPRAPRLIDMSWGDGGPLLTLVGKGVCFDTGGLNLKPGASMGLMKKDMGGAATVLGLAHMIMATGLRLRLRVLIPAVENAVSGDAFRPGDILRARNGLSVEVNNTDAEGRLVLADALALASETPPDLTICMATLTGAARVAVGPDLAPYFTDDDALAMALAHAGHRVRDPLWRLPLHRPYDPMIEPGIADLDNAPSGGMAGAITAALFLDRFVRDTPRFVHFDIYGWNPRPAPARPKGGVGMGARAILDALPGVLDL